jgi:hypothetical protein
MHQLAVSDAQAAGVVLCAIAAICDVVLAIIFLRSG